MIRIDQIILMLIASIFCANVAASQVAAANTVPPWHKGKLLGSVNFDTFSNTLAQQHFITGMKSLYCYEVSEARYSFKKAQALEPKFTMAYVGDIINDYQFIWHTSEPKAAYSTFQKMMRTVDTKKFSKKEHFYVDAVHALSDPKLQSKQKNILAFHKKIREAALAFPNDIELKVLQGYALLGLRYGFLDFDHNHMAGELFKKALDKNSQHPGALHFTLHAFENPIQFPLAGPAALKLGLLAPGSIHAQHMPSHYFLAQGDWAKVYSINKAAWNASKVRMKELKQAKSYLDFHSFNWLIYALEQQGHFSAALNKITELAKIAQKNPSKKIINFYVKAKSTFRADAPLIFQIPLGKLYEPNDAMQLSPFTQASKAYSMAYISFIKNDLKHFAKSRQAFEKASRTAPTTSPESNLAALHIMAKALKGLETILAHHVYKGLHFLREAAILEATAPLESGIPLIIKPSEELLGNVLLMAQRPYEAAYHFNKCLTPYTNRYQCRRGLLAKEKSHESLASLKWRTTLKSY